MAEAPGDASDGHGRIASADFSHYAVALGRSARFPRTFSPMKPGLLRTVALVSSMVLGALVPQAHGGAWAIG